MKKLQEILDELRNLDPNDPGRWPLGVRIGTGEPISCSLMARRLNVGETLSAEAILSKPSTETSCGRTSALHISGLRRHCLQTCPSIPLASSPATGSSGTVTM